MHSLIFTIEHGMLHFFNYRSSMPVLERPHVTQVKEGYPIFVFFQDISGVLDEFSFYFEDFTAMFYNIGCRPTGT
jgi:hypothetical protein